MNGVAGAAFCALAAFDALFVVDHGQIVYHGDCARRAHLCALAARDTAELAYVHDGLSFVVRRTSDVHLCICGNALKKVFGTNVET